MASYTTFYLSRIIGRTVHDATGQSVGIVKDLLVDSGSSTDSSARPHVNGIKLKIDKRLAYYSFQNIHIKKANNKLTLTCGQLTELSTNSIDNSLYLADTVLDKQIVDLNGRKLVRVNDVQFVIIDKETYTIAVDVGIKGLLRRIGIEKPIKSVLTIFKKNIPAKYILWDDVEAIDYSNMNIKLSKSHSKLQTLHPSDLADILEDLGKKASTQVFSSLDEEKAADVLEELETDAQIHILESLSIEKAADVLDKMPADEVADIMDALEDEKAELLLNEMEDDTSQEVRDLLDYPDNAVGSIMSTDILSFNKDITVEEVFIELRDQKPETSTLYNLFVTDENEVLIATLSIRDLVISSPDTKIEQIMTPSPVYLHDNQKMDEIAEIFSKYNLLAIPVVDKAHVLQGMVVIDDVVEDLINKRRTNK